MAELTPPDGSSAPTIGATMPTPPGGADDVTLDGSVPSSMAIPTAWSVPASGSAAASIASIKPGSLLGNRYEILDILGQGGMGAVYKARDRELDRLVALKVIRPELAGQPEILQRFKQELILARKVTHRNVIRIFDLGDADGVKFITMEFIEGHDLKSILAREGKLAPDQAVKIIQQVCLALDAAHTEGVVHRDLKPQNIMLDEQGRASVMDFGIARSLELGGMTQTGALIGTPEYMSPEQVRGEHVDARSDLFTLGVIFQEILTGTLPFQAETAMASMFKRTKEPAIPLRQLNPAVPQTLSDIVAKCLEIQPQDRFQTAREMYDALEAWKNGAAAPIWIRTLRSARRSLRRRDVKLSAAAVGAVVALLLVAVITYQLKKPSKPAVAHAPLSVLVADFTNSTGDPIFDDTLEPMFNVALEGASFINAYNRGAARKLARQLPHPTDKLSEQPARLVAISQGVGAVVTGELSRRGGKYSLSATALDAVSGNVIARTEVTAANKDEVLLAIPKLAAPIRRALGDTTPESVQLAATLGTFSTTSLEAVHQYGLAEEQQFAGKMQDALQSFSRAAELDPNFARAYAGMAGTSGDLGRRQDAEKYAKLAMEHVDRMTERERYRIRGVYYIWTENWQKCVEEFSELTKLYPADNIAHENLAGCYASWHNMPKAVEEARLAVQIAPKDSIARNNFSVFACYAGDFQTCEREAHEVQRLNPSDEDGYLDLAHAQVGLGQLPEAAETYQQLQKLGARGASLAASGLANLDLYQGRYQQAIQILEKGVAADLAAKESDRAADNLAMLAHAEVLRGDKQSAVAAAEKALANSQSAKIRFLAARTFVDAGEIAKGRKLAASLAPELLADPQAYAKLIEGEAALKEHDPRKALRLFTDAKNLADTWIVHFDLGLAYLDAEAFTEADSEFDVCTKRRGEVLELFNDDEPTYSYLPVVYYYQGRAREGLKSPGFADSYRTYVSIRGKAGEDPLLPEIRRRLGK
ncbi:MAG TPA: serine/threonine-protein kinase [Candidatus Acidoferrales bacterium]|nr:serine/threonine-protein kinase [Candidatus Acidoferrales bacterium]